MTDTWYLFNKYVKISLRTPLWTLFNLIQPLIWLLIFGQLFRNMAQLPGFPNASYVDFLVPGVLIMTVLFGSSWSGVSLLREIRSGGIDRLMAAPISRLAVVLSRVLHASVQVVAQTVIILVVATLLGATGPFNALGTVIALIIICLLGTGFAALSNGFAILLQREEPLVVIGNLMTMPLLFFSSAMVPASFLPPWMAYIAHINPIHYAVDGVRAALQGNLDETLALNITMVTVFAVITSAWSIHSFKRLRD